MIIKTLHNKNLRNKDVQDCNFLLQDTGGYKCVISIGDINMKDIVVIGRRESEYVLKCIRYILMCSNTFLFIGFFQ